ncbi:MAG: hypothetical protein ACI379_03930, partial [Nocardioides sp.]|uniref:hypothetical protein n=1 Tax=Nocardioides sp. TaxID=35761 RepID=UPI003F01CE2C
LLALCCLGAVAALVHDPESDRRRLRRTAVVLVVVAALALAATMTLGLPDVVTNPAPGPLF